MLDGVIGIQPTLSRQQHQALVQQIENAVKTEMSTQAQIDKSEERARGATGLWMQESRGNANNGVMAHRGVFSTFE